MWLEQTRPSTLFTIVVSALEYAQGASTSMNMPRLLEKAKTGDSAAIAELYQLHVDSVYRYIYYRVPTSHDAEDLTGEVFTIMVQDLSNYEWTGAPFEAWLYRIAAARIADFYRKNNRQPQVELQDSITDRQLLPEEQLEEVQEVETLRQMMNQLSPMDQTILILRFIERKSHKEVANILGKTPGAIKTMQHRALTRLAELLGSDEKVRHYFRGDHD